MGKVSIVSLGCPKNSVDSDRLIGRLRKEGFGYTPECEDADIVFVNTCGFIDAAKKESVEEILKLRRLKDEGKRLLVFGCLAERYRDELLREIPEIDGLWGVGQEEDIVAYCRGIAPDRKRGAGGRGGPAIAASMSGSYAYLKIAEGCNRGCTFCVIPSIRGPFRSMAPERVLDEAAFHVRSGVKELILVAQDIGSYGREFKGYTLSRLIRDIAAMDGEFWIRLLYLYPTVLNNELLTAVSETGKVVKYLDIPLQHSEDRVLKAMGRPGTREGYVRQIRMIRETVPGVTLRTTFIVGFPGETEEDLAGLKRFVEEMRFERLGVFTYSKEEGTPAARLKGSLPKRLRDKRRDEVMALQSKISLELNRQLAGRRFRVLVDERDGDVAVARLASQAPEIDGVVLIQDAKAIPGRFADVRITEAYEYDLRGVLEGKGVGLRERVKA